MTDARAFRGFRFPAEIILWAVRSYLQFPISYRDLERMLADRGVEVDHTTMYRWVQRFAPELESERLACPPLLIWLGRRSWSRKWTRVSTVIGGHSVAGIDVASAQVPPLER